MGEVLICDECGGAGVRAFDRGPAIETCPRCDGAGLRFTDPKRSARDLRDLLAARGSAAEVLAQVGEGAALRAQTNVLATVEERLDRLEQELAGRG